MAKVRALVASHSTIGALKPAISWPIRLAIWSFALVAAVAPLSPRLVERTYSRGLFPRLQTIVTSISNQTGVALFDVLIVVAVIAWVGFAARDIFRAKRGRRLRAIVPIARRSITLAAVSYLLFLAVWGLNYRRVPMRDKVAFAPDRVSRSAALSLLAETVDRLNALYDAAHRDLSDAPLNERALVAAFDRAGRDIGQPTTTVTGRPKRTLLDPYFRRAGVAGMTDPYFLETFLASDLLPVEQPFIVAHEWSHLAGFADESEANYLGWLTCLRGGDGAQYSGWLFLYGELVPAVPARDARPLVARLGAGPRDDLRAIRERLQRNLNPRVSAAGWKVYDQYLKANRVDEGTESYAEVVTLILGTKWKDGWTPELAP
jgi:hypothetical protein